jgi:hypothetical protein
VGELDKYKKAAPYSPKPDELGYVGELSDDGVYVESLQDISQLPYGTMVNVNLDVGKSVQKGDEIMIEEPDIDTSRASNQLASMLDIIMLDLL